MIPRSVGGLFKKNPNLQIELKQPPPIPVKDGGNFY